MRRCSLALTALLAVSCGAQDKSGGGPADYGQTKDAVLGAFEIAAANGRSLSGAQVNEYEVFIECTSFERMYELTGEWPAILGLELMFIIENPAYRQFFMDRAEQHAARGGVIAITWHARNPVRVCPRGEYYKCSQMAMSDEELSRILNPDTEEHRLWARDIDAVADVLAEMKTKGIAPIFRPYHEMNGGWFWWGQKERYADLWRMLHQRLTEEHSLDNLVWAWSPDKASEGADIYYPGNEAVDMVGADIYTVDREAAMFDAAKRNVAPLHPSGLFAFTEIGLLPAPEIFGAIRPVYFLLWGGEYINAEWAADPCDGCNAAQDVKAIIALDQTAGLHELDWPQEASVRYDRALRAAPPEPSCPAQVIDAEGGVLDEQPL